MLVPITIPSYIQYIGVLEDIPTSIDMSNRGFLLADLDEKRVGLHNCLSHTHNHTPSQNLGQLPWVLGIDNAVSIRLSAYNIKITKEDRTGVCTCIITSTVLSILE